MNSVRVMSIAASVALICAGSVELRIRNVGLPDCFAECQRQHFRPTARSAHAEQEHIRESRALHVLRKRLVIGDLLRLRSTLWSQPSHLSSSALVHIDLSRRHRRRTTPRSRQILDGILHGCFKLVAGLQGLRFFARRPSTYRRHRRTAARLPRSARRSLHRAKCR